MGAFEIAEANTQGGYTADGQRTGSRGRIVGTGIGKITKLAGRMHRSEVYTGLFHSY